MSKCLDDELYDIYIEDGKQVIESLREIYEKGKEDAIDEIIKLVDEELTIDIGMDLFVDRDLLCKRLEQLKEQNQ